MPTPLTHLRRLRLDAGLSIPELATRAGFTREHLARVEAGSTPAGEKLVIALAGVLGVRASELNDTLRRPSKATTAA